MEQLFRPNKGRTRYKGMYYDLETWYSESPKLNGGFTANIYKYSGEMVMYTGISATRKAAAREARYTIRGWGMRK